MATEKLTGVYIPCYFDPKDSNKTIYYADQVFANLTDCDLWILNNTIHPEHYKSIYRPIKY